MNFRKMCRYGFFYSSLKHNVMFFFAVMIQVFFLFVCFFQVGVADIFPVDN